MSTIQATPITVLAAIDFSDVSSLVVTYAVEMARQRHANEIHFLHVNHGPLGDEEAQEARRAELLEWLGARLQGRDGVPHTAKVVCHEASGDPGTLIVEMASDLLSDVVLVGTHGRKGMQRILLGSVSEFVVRYCGCPVVVVRPKMHEQSVPQIAPPCPLCVETRVNSHGETLWCEQHSKKHDRRHTYYNTRLSSWGTQRMIL